MKFEKQFTKLSDFLKPLPGNNSMRQSDMGLTPIQNLLPFQHFSRHSCLFRLKMSVLSLAFMIMGLRAFGEEGMWPPPLINQAIFEQMKAKGFLLTPESIYSTTQPSLKDAVVLFGRGCTAEIISSQSLLLTNHHCGFGQIQSHSTLQNDYLKNGYWAKNQADELPNPGLTVQIMVRMEDVTARLEEGITPGMDSKTRSQMAESNQKKIMAEATAGTHYKAQIRPFFGGLQQWILVYEVFEDIRLVGAPPGSIGKFGGDTDNWVWPRHTGDFSLFRIYAGKDNKPAPYSKDNVPYRPKKYLPVSTAGVKEGDFTMVLGFPGRTMEYLPSYALEVLTEISNPRKIDLRTKRLDIINNAMRSSDALRIKYAATQADIANAWKKWKGELLGLGKSNAIVRKQELEERYRRFFEKREDGKAFTAALDNLKAAYEKQKSLIIPASYQGEAVMANDLFSIVLQCKSLITRGNKLSETEFSKKLNEFKAGTRYVWKDADAGVERALFRVCMEAYRNDIPDAMHHPDFLKFVRENPIENDQFTKTFFDGGKWFDSVYVWKTAEKNLKGDSAMFEKNPTWKLLRVLNQQFQQVYNPQIQKIMSELETNQQIFFTGLMKLQSEKTFYPDANQTFRVAFGNVSGYQPMDGVKYTFQTSTEGIMQKADTELDFMLEEGLKKKFSDQNGKKAVPVAFVASNHSTGGNSGSPVLNARGELIGVNFDRVWEGTMSDYFFDSRICRNITCDIRYILWVIENVGETPRLTREMELKP